MQIATPRANVKYVRQSRIDLNTKDVPAFFPQTLNKALVRVLTSCRGKLKRFKRIASSNGDKDGGAVTALLLCLLSASTPIKTVDTA